MKGSDFAKAVARGEMPDKEQIRESCLIQGFDLSKPSDAQNGQSTQNRKERNSMKTNLRWLIPAAACLVLTIAGIVALRNLGGGFFPSPVGRPSDDIDTPITDATDPTGPVTTPTDPQDLNQVDWTAQYFRIDQAGLSDGVQLIRSAKELAEASEVIQQQNFGGVNEGLFMSERYDDAFFAERFLIFVVTTEPSGSIRHKVTSVSLEDGERRGRLQINIERHLPEVGTDDMAGWLIAIELDNYLADLLEPSAIDLIVNWDDTPMDDTQLAPPVDINVYGIGDYAAGYSLQLTASQKRAIHGMLEETTLSSTNPTPAPDAYRTAVEISCFEPQGNDGPHPALPPAYGYYYPYSDGTFKASSAGGGYVKSQELFDYVCSLVKEQCGVDIASYNANDIRDLVSAELRFTADVSADHPVYGPNAGKSQIVTDPDSLRKIESMFQNARVVTVGGCPYGVLDLTLTRADGRTFKYSVAADSCDNALSEFAVCVEYGVQGSGGNRRAQFEAIFDDFAWM